MPTTANLSPRDLTNIPIETLPAGPVFAAADPIDGHHAFGDGVTGLGARSRDAHGRHGVRVAVLSGDVEVDVFYSLYPREDAEKYLAAHPGVTFALLTGVDVRDCRTGEVALVP